MRYYCRIGSGTSGRGRPLFQFFNQASEQVLVYLYVSLDGSPICAEFRRRVVKRALSRNPFVQSRKKKSRPSYRLVYCFDCRHTALWLLHLPTKNCNQKATHFIGDRVALSIHVATKSQSPTKTPSLIAAFIMRIKYASLSSPASLRSGWPIGRDPFSVMTTIH